MNEKEPSKDNEQNLCRRIESTTNDGQWMESPDVRVKQNEKFTEKWKYGISSCMCSDNTFLENDFQTSITSLNSCLFFVFVIVCKT